MGRTAVITGITGQDGSYLADILLEKGYKVIGMSRRRSGGGDWRIKHLLEHPNFTLEFADVTDSGSLHRLVEAHGPDEFYNLAAQSFVALSWREPVHTGMVTAIGVTNCLEALRNVKPDCRYYQASSSEMFGLVKEMPQNEQTPFHPRSPYGVAKVYGYWMTRNYRESHDMFTCNGILFNHESPRRGIEFVTRKITDGAARIKLGLQDKLGLGNLDAQRDWGHARDYMEAAWLMLQLEHPDDFVVSTGKAFSIRQLLEIAFGELDLDPWQYVYVDPKFYRPAEVDILLGDPTKAKEVLGWNPKYTFEDMIKEMVVEDLKRIRCLL